MDTESERYLYTLIIHYSDNYYKGYIGHKPVKINFNFLWIFNKFVSLRNHLSEIDYFASLNIVIFNIPKSRHGVNSYSIYDIAIKHKKFHNLHLKYSSERATI